MCKKNYEVKVRNFFLKNPQKYVFFLISKLKYPFKFFCINFKTTGVVLKLYCFTSYEASHEAVNFLLR